MTPTQLVTTCLLVFAVSVSAGCQAAIVPESRVLLQGEVLNQEEIQRLELYNCDGKSEVTRTESRGFSVSVTVSEEIAASVGASAEVISAEVEKLVGASQSDSVQRDTAVTLAAPPQTWMRFELVWNGPLRIGVVQNFRATTIPIAFSSFVPEDVRIRSQEDLGCPTGVASAVTPIAAGTPAADAPVAQEPASPPVIVETPQPVVPNPTSEVRYVASEKTGSGRTVSYEFTLDADEIIVGDSYSFNGSATECNAFLITGGGTVAFTITDGGWYRYAGVTAAEAAEELLARHVNYLEDQHEVCKYQGAAVHRVKAGN